MGVALEFVCDFDDFADFGFDVVAQVLLDVRREATFAEFISEQRDALAV